jgi:broad specificity phosphatase PhoE
METLARDSKLVIGMVGLPARGKTYISRKITRYLNWLGFKCAVFNIGEYRRTICGTKECTANFFDPANGEAVKARNECANMALDDLIKYLKEGGDVAIYDGTNTTIDRRKMVKDVLDEKLENHTLMWIESICNDDKIIETNIRMTKLSSPDYRDVDSETATKDFRQRIEEYRKRYEEVTKEGDGEDTSFIKLYDVGHQFNMNNIAGYIESKIVSFLMNLHITPRPIYFTRHGQSLFNIEDRVGGDPDLSERGMKYAGRLGKFFEEEFERGRINHQTKILTSTLKRAVTTAGHLKFGPSFVSLKLLDELNAGVCDGLTYEDITEKFPIEIKERKNDKLHYRYPRGESYLDVIQRIEPIIFEIERSKEPVIVVAHQAIIRCLYAYFSKHDIVEIPYISIPLHTVIKLIPGTYYAHETNYKVDVDTGNIEEVNVVDYTLIEDYRSVRA